MPPETFEPAIAPGGAICAAVSMRKRLPGLLLACCGIAIPQSSASRQVTLGADCGLGTQFYQTEGYQVDSVVVETPFDFLGSLKSGLTQARNTLPQKPNEPFDDGKVTAGAQKLTDVAGGSGSVAGAVPGAPVQLTAVAAYIQNCRMTDGVKKLDVLYRVYTSRIPFFTSRVFESNQIEEDDPVEGAGLADRVKYSAAPRAGFNAAAKAGFGLDAAVRNIGPLDSLSFAGGYSGQSRQAEGGLNGSWAPARRFLEQLDWRADYALTEEPSETGRLRKNRGSFQASALIASLGQSGALRTGFAAEGGQQGSRETLVDLPPGVVERANYASWKLYMGFSHRSRRNSLASSYGVQWGTTGDGFENGFRKQVADLAYALRVFPLRPRRSGAQPAKGTPAADEASTDEQPGSFEPLDPFEDNHKPWEIDVRLTAGWIANKGGLPVSERFFGGNVQQDFIRGNTWRIRANPVIRSFSQNRLDRLGGGMPIGGENFVSLNISFAPTLWRKTLVPDELQGNEEFRQQLNFGLSGAAATLQTYYESRDQAFAAVDAHLPAIEEALGEMTEQYDAIRDMVPETFEKAFAECDDALSFTTELMDRALQGDRVTKLSNLSSLVRDEEYLSKVVACVAELKSLFAGRLDHARASLGPRQNKIEEILRRIDVKAAAAKTAQDMTFVRRVLRAFVEELNILSFSPVLMFDMARIGPQPDPSDGFRYGIGAGGRLNLVNSVRVTVGYAWNPRPKGWERGGALIASLDFVDLFY